jgi:putative transposase
MRKPEPQLHKTRRRLPHWSLDGSVYFVTFRLASGLLSEMERTVILDHIRRGDGRFYRLLGVVVMPDHVHLVFKPAGELNLSRIMKGIKGVTARLINQARDTRGQVWQDESWDRIIRDESEYLGVMEYLADNPVELGLCRADERYNWLYLNLES